VGAALVISAGVGKSGVIGRLIRNAEPYMRSAGSQVFVLAFMAAVLSSFVKNIAALAIFLPVSLQIARRSGTSASTLLMPMAFASLIGELVTLVGTSPNLLVSRVREEILGAFLTVGWRFLPVRRGAQTAEDSLNVNAYVIEATLPKISAFVDKTVNELEALADGSVTVIAIIREHGHQTTTNGQRGRSQVSRLHGRS